MPTHPPPDINHGSATINTSDLAVRSIASPRVAVLGISDCFLDRRNERANSVRTAKLMFCGRAPAARRKAAGDTELTTTPTASPWSLTNGPPEFPGCTGTVI